MAFQKVGPSGLVLCFGKAVLNLSNCDLVRLQGAATLVASFEGIIAEVTGNSSSGKITRMSAVAYQDLDSTGRCGRSIDMRSEHVGRLHMCRVLVHELWDLSSDRE
jgi:hypothetical protein